MDARFRQGLRAPAGVLEERVTAVQDQVALLQERQQLPDYRIHRCPGLDHQHDLSGTLQRIYKFLQGIKGE